MLIYAYEGRAHAWLTFDGLKLAAAIGTPKTVKVTNQSPPRRRKNDPGLNSAHEYKEASFSEEYSFTCKQTTCEVMTSYISVCMLSWLSAYSRCRFPIIYLKSNTVPYLIHINVLYWSTRSAQIWLIIEYLVPLYTSIYSSYSIFWDFFALQ